VVVGRGHSCGSDDTIAVQRGGVSTEIVTPYRVVGGVDRAINIEVARRALSTLCIQGARGAGNRVGREVDVAAGVVFKNDLAGSLIYCKLQHGDHGRNVVEGSPHAEFIELHIVERGSGTASDGPV